MDTWRPQPHQKGQGQELPGAYRSITNVNPLSWEDEIHI